MPMLETNLHPLSNPGAPGIPEYGKADINLNLVVNNTGGVFSVNGAVYKPPTVPVLLQILSGAQEATDLMPDGNVIVLAANKVVELTMSPMDVQHPIHLHGHGFDVVQSGGNSFFNYLNPVRRDVVSSGAEGQQWSYDGLQTIRDPGFCTVTLTGTSMRESLRAGLGRCDIDCPSGFAIVIAESPSDTRKHLKGLPAAWDNLCPIYNSLTPSQLGAVNSYEEAANISSLLLPN
ncbi:Cupredoxin [Rhizopogon vinicolor AM-OR11-026]|uniref:Cupredoxin n=1 Tax=Rhizopogon vinicolor AM-OR11-026 TaxID=1314800 RepID=A0A1B7MP67_9AGAM|nr:Cupredoxin [Rhizopogon vinicolor AM-OR11-026]